MGLTFDRFEMDAIINALDVMLNTFKIITNYLSSSIRDYVEIIQGPAAANLLPDWLGSLSPLALMFGVSLPLYLGWQLFSWITNPIT